MSNDLVEEQQETSRTLSGIEFLTGEDPSAGSFLLVVGIVTCVFIAAFQFTLPDQISNVLTGLVIVVAVISFLMGAILDALGYFDVSNADD
jgi:tetrahydromethanopterin S-methyltransferase subunit C